MFKLPYSLVPTGRLAKISKNFLGIGEILQDFFPFVKSNLRQAEIEYLPKEYLSMCFLSSFLFFSLILILSSIVLIYVRENIILGLIISLVCFLFVFLQQVAYPKIHINRRVKNIERNLIAALQNLWIQINSGVPLFDSLVNISKENYGEISKELTRVVKQINAGTPQIDALEEIATINPSLFFRRAVWQIVNGMKSGSDLSNVLNEIINLLSEEQVLQIQRYGSQLNPLAMFYMLIVVIIPSLGCVFLIMISSFVSLPELTTKMIFWGFFAIIVFFQIMFMGLIKSKRPNLLGE